MVDLRTEFEFEFAVVNDKNIKKFNCLLFCIFVMNLSLFITGQYK